MTLTIRTEDNLEPTEVFDGSRLWEADDACDHGGIIENLPDIPTVPNIDTAILAAIEAGGVLQMANWHGPDTEWEGDDQPPPLCGTTHCRCGWAVHLCGEAGYALEARYGVETAGTLIYAASDPGSVKPDFYATDEEALADLRARAAGGAK